MKDSEKLDHLAGEVNALVAFASAVIRSSPNVDKLAREFALQSEKQLSFSLPIAVSEHFLAGQRASHSSISDLLRIAASREDVTIVSELSDVEIALISAINSLIELFMALGVKPQTLIEIFEHQKSGYLKKGMPDAAAVMELVRDFCEKRGTSRRLVDGLKDLPPDQSV